MPNRPPVGPVRVAGYSLADDDGPFLGLGVSYFTALWRCKHDRARLERDLSFLAKAGFNYYRMLSMVGYYTAWEGLEISPVSFTNREGKQVQAWSDYWEQLTSLLDLAYDKFGLRTQITIFADAQLMPTKQARIEHMSRLLRELQGREHKVMLLEVANEAWQNGFPGEQGVSDLRDFARFLGRGTEIPIAITSDHESEGAFDQLYRGEVSDLATWHFSRDRSPDDGWAPVYDCWDYAVRAGLPPVISNEPIGPGASVSSEKNPVRLVMAAAFAYTAKLPAYVFHSEAGVFGKTTFEDTPGVSALGHLLFLLPPDLPNWQRNDGRTADAPFTAYAGGQVDRYWPEVPSSTDGCLRNVGSRKGNRFVCVPIGIRDGGLKLEARRTLKYQLCDPITGRVITTNTVERNAAIRLSPGLGAWIIIGEFLP